MNPREIIKLIWPELKRDHTQKELTLRLGQMGVKISEPHLSNVHRQIVLAKAAKKTDTSLSEKLENQLADAFLAILEHKEHKTIDLKEKKLVEISLEHPAKANHIAASPTTNNVLLHEGRMEMTDKVKFFSSATSEIIEIGVRLNTFTQHYYGQKETLFKKPLLDLLNRGVNMKYLMMNPENELAKLYFKDRAMVLPKEKGSPIEMITSLNALKEIRDELNKASSAGKMEIYIYDSLASNHYFIVDGKLNTGKMLLAPYLYGISRANSPVLELYREQAKTAFERYWESAQQIIKKAQKI